MSVTDDDLVERMAKKHSVSPAAVQVVLAALRSGGGQMAQFSHADFGGMSQWSPGMSMASSLVLSCVLNMSPTRGIRVNTISPGPIITPILDKGGLTPAQKDGFIEGAKTRIPLGRTGTAAEVAAAALYLAADATYTTGAELFVDGGLIDL
jgi:Enoyl-(Acyl carrier protein) reductase